VNNFSFPELKDTESAHREAMHELERMKDTMEKMEQERAEMVAEVEAQIERALQSMTVDIDDSESDYEDSRPPSRLSNISSEAAQHPSVTMNQLRSSSTESTLAESYDAGGDEAAVAQTEQQGDAVEEVEEEKVNALKKKRFSASLVEVPQDGMTAVDESISQRSDKIAQKVLEIQQKVGFSLLFFWFLLMSNDLL
jgi:nicotinamide N-methyltransferase